MKSVFVEFNAIRQIHTSPDSNQPRMSSRWLSCESSLAVDGDTGMTKILDLTGVR